MKPSEAAWPGPDCPPRDALERLAHLAPRPDERDHLVDHLVDCPRCAGLVRELRSLEPWSEQMAAESARASRPRTTSVVDAASRFGRRPTRPRRPALRPLAVAATIALAVLGAFLLRDANGPPGDPDARRGVEQSTLSPAPDARLDAWPSRFEWPPEPGAEAYRLVIVDELGEVVWTSPWQESTTATVPHDVFDSGSGVYLWSVDVRGAVTRERLGPHVLSVVDGD